jgi:CRP-like cAMP-binding protein
LKSFDSELIARVRLDPLVFKTGQKIEQPGKPIKNLYFLEGGMASMTTLFDDGTEVEVGMFGYKSVIGVSALMGTIQSLNHVYTQIEGTGFRCSYECALKEFERFGIFHKRCLRYVQAQLVQSSQSAGCASMHNHEQRLARWLLISADRAHVDLQDVPGVPLSDARQHTVYGVCCGRNVEEGEADRLQQRRD